MSALKAFTLLKTGDYRLNEEQPPLSKILAGLPLLFINPHLDPSWVDDKQWDFSHKFFFESGNNPDLILFLARVPFILMGVILGIYVYKWSKELFGLNAGLLSLFFYTFSPNIIAHSRLAATDFLVTAFVFISFYYFYKYLKHKSKTSLYISGIIFGFALSSKFTSLYMLPVFFIYIFLHTNSIKKSAKYLPSILILFILSFFVLSLTYSFKINVFLDGLHQVIVGGTIGRFSYLLGKHYIGRSLLYFPIAFLFKTPIPFLIILIVFKKYELKKSKFLFVPVLFFFLVSLLNKTNLGLRHILVIYPFLHVYAGNIIKLKKESLKLIFGFLLLWYGFSSLFIFPNYLAYFNELSLGPNNGYKILIDSNLDWGQDLKQLSHYLRDNNIDEIYISYFGNDDLDYRIIKYQPLECKPTTGIIAISVNQLIGIRESVAACNNWLMGFQPVKKIGYTIWVFNITKEFTPEDIKRHELQYNEALNREYLLLTSLRVQECEAMCESNCKSIGKQYLRSELSEDKCLCKCV